MIGNHPSNKGGMTSVISQITEHDWSNEGIKLIFIPTFLPGNPLKKMLFFVIALIKILWIFVFSKPDIVYMHLSYKGSFIRKYIVHKLCILFSINDIVHLHGTKFFDMYKSSASKKRKRIEELISKCKTFIVLGEHDAAAVKEIVPDAKVIVVQNAIQIPDYKVQWNSKCHLLYMGVLIPAKGVADLLQSLNCLQATRTDVELKLEICGIGSEEEKLKQYVCEHSLEKVVKFNGWVSGERKVQMLRKANLLVLPSYTEGLPIAVLEAMSYGMPIISTQVGDLAELVKDGVNGYLIQPGNIEALSKCILLMTDKQRWEKFSYMSRAIVEEKFSMELFYSRLLEIFKQTAAIY